MLRPSTLRPFLFPTLLLAACGASPPATPTAVLEQFFQALTRNDQTAARQLLAAGERDDSAWNLDSGPARHGFSLGECEIDGDTAVVPVALGEPRTTIQHVLVREDGAWRLSLQQTTARMTGFDPKRLREQIQEALNRRGTGVQGIGMPVPPARPAPR